MLQLQSSNKNNSMIGSHRSMKATVLRRLSNTALGAATFIFPLACYSLSRRWRIGMSFLHNKVIISKTKKYCLRYNNLWLMRKMLLLLFKYNGIRVVKWCFQWDKRKDVYKDSILILYLLSLIKVHINFC